MKRNTASIIIRRIQCWRHRSSNDSIAR